MPSFRLSTILWAMALLAASMGNFGTMGTVVAACVMMFWAAVFHPPRISITEWFVIIGILLVLAALLIPAQSSARWPARQTQCMNQLSQITKALRWYEHQHGAFPAAQGSAAQSSPTHSWRVDILLPIEEKTLWQAYHFHEPWDSPHNVTVGQSPVEIYACPSDPPLSLSDAYANYFAIVDSQAAWLPNRGRALDEFKDGAGQTILLIDVAGRDIPWSSPNDLSIDVALRLLTGEMPLGLTHFVPPNHGFFYKYEPNDGVHVAFADGRVVFLPVPIPKDLAIALLTIDGGEAIDRRELDRLTQPQLDLAKCYAFAAFVALAVAPVWRLFSRRVRETNQLT